MRPNIGVFIPTPGRVSLLRTLNSVLCQGLEGGDDILVVGDGYSQIAKDIVDLFGSPFRYVATRRTRDWGHSQVNYGLKHVRGDYIVGQDDDDIFLPRAFDEMRDIISKLESPRPIMGRVMSPFLGILWKEPAQPPFDGHCPVIPNDKKKVGYFGLEYAGDQKWIECCFTNYDKCTWADRIWSLTRPEMKLWPRPNPDTVNTMDTYTLNFHRDDNGIWEEKPAIVLAMKREGEHWNARLYMLTVIATIDEIEEVVQWAAWAAQGSDVWVQVPHSQSMVVPALVRSGFQLHEQTQDMVEYTKDWPPHTFEPEGS